MDGLGKAFGMEPFSDWTCADIVNYFTGAERVRLMEERADIRDEEGDRCREWLQCAWNQQRAS